MEVVIDIDIDLLQFEQSLKKKKVWFQIIELNSNFMVQFDMFGGK